MSTTHRNLIRRRDAFVRQVADMAVKLTTVDGEQQVFGAGAARFYVAFPVWFCHKPHFTSGLRMDRNFLTVAGSVPEHSATVETWDRRRVSGGFDGYYVGATIVAVISGRANQQTWVQWKMEGKALTNPVSPDAARRHGGDV